MKRVAATAVLLALLGAGILITRGGCMVDRGPVDPPFDGSRAKDSIAHSDGGPDRDPVLRGPPGVLEPSAHAAPSAVRVVEDEPPPVPDPVRAPVAALLDALSSQDANVRREAAERIVEAGYFAIERFARHAGSLDAESWQAFAHAVAERTWPPNPAGALVSAAHTAPAAHRRRLIELARRLDPQAGRTPTTQEVEAIVRRELVEKRGLVDDDPGGAVVLFGHAGVPVALRLLEEGTPDTVDFDRAGTLLSAIAQPEDIPALRRLLLEGMASAATALGRLDALGYGEALDVLIESMRSGRFDGRIAGALSRSSNPRRAARAVREWMNRPGRSPMDIDRARAANVFAALGSRVDVAAIEAWSASTGDPATLLALARALTHLGSVRGIDLLVRIVGEERADPPPRSGPTDPGRLTAAGFERYERWVALRSLNAVAVQVGEPDDEEGPWKGLGFREMDDVGPDVRAWWEAVRARIRFDEAAGTWRLESD